MNDDWITGRGAVRSLDRQYIPRRRKSRSFEEVRRYFVDVIEHVLHDDLALFEGGEKIWWDQCDFAISHLNTLITLIHNLCAAIDDQSYSPIMVSTSPSSNALIVKLHYADMQLCRLLELVSAFRSACQSGPKRDGKKREEICHRLKIFMMHCNDLLQSMAIQREPILEKLAQRVSATAVALSPSPLVECRSSSCQLQPPTERERIDIAQWKRSFPDYLRPVPIGPVETTHDRIREAEEDASERPFSG